ncbi:DUF4397 domain-containing protein [Foetidibacter luteolus]|uniref:DUF4397 domain-containing protein n=1 Tax=Foetidibacter luteolus TaxID=2608880 RepID=UPI00129B7DEB|nr:DUF4397 domain-containing protein [Foetidibacter luteolus]
MQLPVKIPFVLFLFIFLLQACKKSEVTVSNCNIGFTNVSPDAGPLDFLVNANVISGGLTYAASSGYVSTVPGTYSMQLTNTGSSDALFSFTGTLTTGKYYSLYAIDSLSRIRPIIIEDNFIADTARAKARFFQFSPGLAKVDMMIKPTEKDTSFNKATGRTFNDQDTTNTFQNFDAFTADTCNVTVWRSKDSVVLAEKKNYIFKKSKLYTLLLTGTDTAASSTRRLTIQITEH